MRTHDIIVVGLGTVGAATCGVLARKGFSVLGLDAFRPPHNFGSHHGESRSIRRAYLEGSAYVPMALRAWESWRQLERESATSLLLTTGNLTIGPPDAPAVTGFLASARRYGIDHELLTATDLHERWPLLSVPSTFVAALETRAGIVFPETAINVFLRQADHAGAELRFNEPMTRWTDHGGRISVRTPSRVYEAGRLLMATGARGRRQLGQLGRWLSPKWVPVHWAVPPDEHGFRLGAFPVNFWQLPVPGQTGTGAYQEFYSLPVIHKGGRVKIAPHNHLRDCDPERPPEAVSAQDTLNIRAFLRRYIPSLADAELNAHTCLYAMTPDGEFSLGALPGHPNVFSAALAGHGFKFAPVLGEIMADMLIDETPGFDIAMFAPDRF